MTSDPFRSAKVEGLPALPLKLGVLAEIHPSNVNNSKRLPPKFGFQPSRVILVEIHLQILDSQPSCDGSKMGKPIVIIVTHCLLQALNNWGKWVGSQAAPTITIQVTILHSIDSEEFQHLAACRGVRFNVLVPPFCESRPQLPPFWLLSTCHICVQSCCVNQRT